MISLKKMMEGQLQELLALSLAGYRSTVDAVAATGDQVCPPLAGELQQSLLALRDRLSQSAPPGALEETTREIDREVGNWGSAVAGYYKQKATEIQEIVLAMAEVATAVAARDDRYKTQFGEVTARLYAVGDLEDIARIRALVSETATELCACVDRMVEDGRRSIGSLQKKVMLYEYRLAEAERRAMADSLTGLANRRSVEFETAARVAGGRAFCLAVIDLNGFKQINDAYGHLAGDAVLKHFARELQAQFRTQDVVGRWGGDEFVVVQDCDLAEAGLRIERIRKWVFGKYALDARHPGIKVDVSGSIGLAAWAAGKTAEELFAEADRSMLQQKAGSAR